MEKLINDRGFVKFMRESPNSLDKRDDTPELLARIVDRSADVPIKRNPPPKAPIVYNGHVGGVDCRRGRFDDGVPVATRNPRRMTGYGIKVDLDT